MNMKSYQEDDDDADVLWVLPELFPGNHLGVVNEPNGEDEQAEQLHQHGGLKATQHNRNPMKTPHTFLTCLPCRLNSKC